jgi:hypothetical protein
MLRIRELGDVHKLADNVRHGGGGAAQPRRSPPSPRQSLAARTASACIGLEVYDINNNRLTGAGFSALR